MKTELKKHKPFSLPALLSYSGNQRYTFVNQFLSIRNMFSERLFGTAQFTSRQPTFPSTKKPHQSWSLPLFSLSSTAFSSDYQENTLSGVNFKNCNVEAL